MSLMTFLPQWSKWQFPVPWKPANREAVFRSVSVCVLHTRCCLSSYYLAVEGSWEQRQEPMSHQLLLLQTHLATSLQIKLIFRFFGKGSWQSDQLLSFCFCLLTMCWGENTLNIRAASWHTRTKVSSLRIGFDGLGSGMPSFYERCQPSTPGFHYISHLWTFSDVGHHQ